MNIQSCWPTKDIGTYLLKLTYLRKACGWEFQVTYMKWRKLCPLVHNWIIFLIIKSIDQVAPFSKSYFTFLYLFNTGSKNWTTYHHLRDFNSETFFTRDDDFAFYDSSVFSFSDQAATNMVSSQKNIAVWGEECSTVCKDNCEAHPICRLCRPCISTKLRNSLLKAHREYLHQGDFRRLYPPAMVSIRAFLNFPV